MNITYKDQVIELKKLSIFAMCDQRIIEEFYNFYNFYKFYGHWICVTDEPHTELSFLNDPRETEAFLKILGYEYKDDENVKSLMRQYHHLFEIVLWCFGNGIEYNDGVRMDDRTITIQNPEYALSPRQQKRLFEFLIPYLKAFNIVLITNSQEMINSAEYYWDEHVIDGQDYALVVIDIDNVDEDE